MYPSKLGDTWVKISRANYGHDSGAGLISGANPGIVEPLKAGIQVRIPPDPLGDLFDAVDTTEENPNAISIKIGEEIFKDVISITVDKSLSRFSTFSFVIPYDPVKCPFKQLRYQIVNILLGGQLFLRGYCVNPLPVETKDRVVLQVTGYSLPATLLDCTMPVSSYPLDFTDLSLVDMVKKIASPFGYQVEVGDGVPNKKFKKSSLDIGTIAGGFIFDMAKQRGVVVTDTNEGAILLQVPKNEGLSIIEFSDDLPPAISVEKTSEPRAYYSSITGVSPTTSGELGGRYTVNNPHLDVIRPFTYRVNDAGENGLEAAVKNKAANMFSRAIAYTVKIPTWRSRYGSVIIPGDIAGLQSSKTMLPNRARFIIKSISYSSQGDSLSAAMTLVLPEAYQSKIPEGVPWD